MLTVSPFRGCSGLERTDFKCIYFGKGVAFLKELNSTVSTLHGCGGLKRPEFKSFYFGMVWWS